MKTKNSRQVVAAVALLLMCLCLPISVTANPVNESICDATADHFLAAESYPEAIRHHRVFLRKYAVLAVHEALYNPPALILLVSPSLRQSSELFRKCAS
jgi:hypothetical protein